MKQSEAQVTPINDPDSLDTLKQWISTMGGKGVLPPAMMKNWSTAVQRLSAILSDDEPRTVTFLRAHIDDIGRRWINLNTANPETGQTYVQRAKVALEEYTSFCDDPLKYKPKAPRTSPPRTPSAKPEDKKTKAPSQAQKTAEVPTAGGEMRSFPLGQAGTFMYALPMSGITVKDVLKISCHLLTYAADFDPTSKVQAQVFTLARTDD